MFHPAVLRDGPVITVRVPAKANLFLAIGGLRGDGFHEVVTVLQTVALYDELSLSIAGPPGQGHHPAARRRMRVVLTHDAGSDMPSDHGNLAVRAAWALGHVTRVLDLVNESQPRRGGEPVTVLRLSKRIPVGGGMAGGSADAAAALVGLNELWGCGLSRQNLEAVGSALGTDVPFCCMGGSALGTGRGVTLAPIMCGGAFWWVICQDHGPLSTGEVYRAWDRRCSPTGVKPDEVLSALRTGDAVALGAALRNELEPAAFALRPGLAEAKAALIDAGALGAVLSGSGPTLLALCASQQAATALASAVADRFRAVTVARSPAGGPEVTRR